MRKTIGVILITPFVLAMIGVFIVFPVAVAAGGDFYPMLVIWGGAALAVLTAAGMALLEGK